MCHWRFSRASMLHATAMLFRTEFCAGVLSMGLNVLMEGNDMRTSRDDKIHGSTIGIFEYSDFQLGWKRTFTCRIEKSFVSYVLLSICLQYVWIYFFI